MKIAHLADLHIGKRVNEYSMIRDQKYILAQILDRIEEIKPEAVLIAGDVYDKSVPSAEAVELFDDFLVKLARKNTSVFVISGNHDSPERIAFGGRLMASSNIYMSPVYDGKVEPVSLEDEYGEVNFYLLPFIKPVNVNRSFGANCGSRANVGNVADGSISDDVDTDSNSTMLETATNYTEALQIAIDNMNIDPSKRNVLVTHQFVTGGERTESEEISVGGTDNVDVRVFEEFDYVALGHLHRAQKCESERVRYSGTPLKYSFSEAKDCKSITLVELKDKTGGRKQERGDDTDKCDIEISEIELRPLHDMAEIEGTYEEIMSREFYEGTTYQEDYMRITLTDEEDIPDAIAKLRSVYHNIMRLDYNNARTRSSIEVEAGGDAENKSPAELFEDLYEMQNGKEMSEVQAKFLSSVIEEIWDGE